jgi:Lipase (class 3)
MATPATTLQGRLLCASGCAYAVMAGEATLDPEAAIPYYAGVGFTQPPAAFVAGVDDIDACLVGTTGDGVVVAFRGTLPLDGPFTLPKLLDWINNLNADPVAGDGLPGAVHRGFLDSLNSLWSSVRDEAKRQLAAAGGGTKLLITGHSKGGGIAPLAAMRFHTEDAVTAKVITFAAPKSGDEVFAAAYNPTFDHTRYEYADDIVPHLPPSAPLLELLTSIPFFGKRLTGLTRFDYERVGSLVYITRSLQFIPGPDDTLLPARRLSLIKLILTGQVQQIADDHRMACGYGYMTALCPQGVCPPPVTASVLQ